MTTTTMKKSELKTGYSIFGNKGSVWSNACHISRDNDRTGRTLCGVPMLSNNWARIEDVQEIGCPDCLSIYQADLDDPSPCMSDLDKNGDINFDTRPRS